MILNVILLPATDIMFYMSPTKLSLTSTLMKASDNQYTKLVFFSKFLGHSVKESLVI
jgi:hypothetical protein